MTSAEKALLKLEEHHWLNGGRSTPLVVRALIGEDVYNTIRAALQRQENVDGLRGIRSCLEKALNIEYDHTNMVKSAIAALDRLIQGEG
jgi:hypothetical protein